MIPIVETAAGVVAVNDTAAAPRVCQLMAGEIDLGAELGIDPGYPVWLSLRLGLVVASAAAGIGPPIGPVSPDFRDLERLEAETRELYRIGFRSRAVIHPAQVTVVNQALAPSASEVERAARIVELYERALAEGRGSVIDDSGRMVDEAVVKVAHRIVEAAARTQAGPAG